MQHPSLETPIPIIKLQPYMPHRPPMVWIDEVVRYSSTDGECALKLREDMSYMGPDGIRCSAPIEWIAQSFGYIWACVCLERKISSTGATRAFLVSIKDAVLNRVGDLKPGDRVIVKIDQIRQMGQIQILRGRVFRGEELILEAGMKVFSELGA